VSVGSPREGATVDVKALATRCEERLADYKRPHRVLVWSELPIGATGKVLRREVKRKVLEG